MKKIIPFLSLLICVKLFAQQPDNYAYLEVKSISKVNYLPSLITFSQGNENRPSADNINAWFRKNLSANSEFNLVNLRSNSDVAGFTHAKYQQFYNNIPVEGGIVNTHSKNGSIESLNGSYFPQLSVNTVPGLSESNALSTVLSKYPNVEFAWQNKAEESFLKEAQNNPMATYYPHGDLVIVSREYSLRQDEFRLAYKFDIYVTEPLSREMVYIDAITGEILFNNPLIQNTEVIGGGNTRYAGFQKFSCDSLTPDSFILRSTSRGKGIQTYNANSLSKVDTNKFYENNSGSWDLKNATQDDVALDIQWGMEKTYDFYKQVLGINSINDSGYRVIGLAHYKNKYNNAAWNNGMLNFGDGDGVTFRPLTSIDICGHEMTHGLTQKCAGLIYKGESGGLNESFSDIFGKCVEQYFLTDSFTWKIGERVQFGGEYLRSMSDPFLKKNPKFYGGQYFIQPTSFYDNGGVHINSGIQNYWFYLLCEGGTGFRELGGEPFYVKPIGWDKATAVAYSNLANYLTPNSDFQDASDLSQLVARTLYGEDSEEAKMVHMAWYAVGLAELPANGIKTEKISRGINIYPNPAENLLKVAVKSNKLMKAELMDISGRTLRSVNLFNGAEIDITSLDKGVYMLQLEDGSCIKFAKI